jgi:hypothetical protein
MSIAGSLHIKMDDAPTKKKKKKAPERRGSKASQKVRAGIGRLRDTLARAAHRATIAEATPSLSRTTTAVLCRPLSMAVGGCTTATATAATRT